jgi:hypothetical protein
VAHEAKGRDHMDAGKYLAVLVRLVQAILSMKMM